MTIKGLRREQLRRKARYGMKVDGANVRRVQMHLIEREQARRNKQAQQKALAA